MVILQIGRRRCDERCRKAKSPKCRCLCGGKYHGRKIPERVLKKLRRQRGTQLELFPKPPRNEQLRLLLKG